MPESFFCYIFPCNRCKLASKSSDAHMMNESSARYADADDNADVDANDNADADDNADVDTDNVDTGALADANQMSRRVFQQMS